MLTSSLKGKIVRAAVGVAATSLMIGTSLIGGTPAGADPKQASALAGYGSDTTQDILNALAGFTNNNNFVPVQSSLATFKKQIVSWDAVGSPCITPKAGGQSIVRPNGSTNGRRALSRAIDGGNWPVSTPDLRRRSRGPASPSPCTTSVAARSSTSSRRRPAPLRDRARSSTSPT